MCNVPLDDSMLESQGHEFCMAAARQDGLTEAAYRLESGRQINVLKSAGAKHLGIDLTGKRKHRSAVNFRIPQTGE